MKELLNEAKQEIIALRRGNEILSAQMGVVEIFAAALGLKRHEGGMSPDVVWALQKKIDELTSPPPAAGDARENDGTAAARKDKERAGSLEEADAPKAARKDKE